MVNTSQQPLEASIIDTPVYQRLLYVLNKHLALTAPHRRTSCTTTLYDCLNAVCKDTEGKSKESSCMFTT